MSLKLIYITNQEEIAIIAENNGVDLIFIDLEIKGKEKRQKGRDTVISKHHFEDIIKIKKVLNNSKLIVRVNPINISSKKEIDKVINNGADIIMLPYFKTVEEVETFLESVDKRIKTCLLVETASAVEKIDEILKLEGIDSIYIGLNDLHLSYRMKFLFEPLANGTVEKLCSKFKKKGIPYGFGGVASLGKGFLPAEKIIPEHYRLGSSMVILSRSFCNTGVITDLNEIERLFKIELKHFREYEAEIQKKDDKFFEENRIELVKKVEEIISNIK